MAGILHLSLRYILIARQSAQLFGRGDVIHENIPQQSAAQLL